MSRLFAVVVYSTDAGDPAGGQRVHDHVFLTEDPKPHIDRLEELYERPLNAHDSHGRVLYSIDSWEPTEEQKKMGFNWNHEARVAAHVSCQKDV